MGDRVLTAEEANYVRKYVARRKKQSRMWAYMRYVNFAIVALMFALAAYSYDRSVKISTDGLDVGSLSYDTKAITRSELENELLFCRVAAYGASGSLFVGCFFMVTGLGILAFTVNNWNRHIQDRILVKFANAMPAILEEHGSG